MTLAGDGKTFLDVRPDHVKNTLVSMAWHYVRVVSENHAPCRKSMHLGTVLCARMMLVVACSVLEALSNLVIVGVYHGSSVVSARERSAVQRPDGTCAPLRMDFQYKVMHTVVLEKNLGGQRCRYL